MTRLADRVALSTGAASGIGRAIALIFAAEGGSVVVADRNVAGAAETVDRITAAGGSVLALGDDILRIDEPTWDFNLGVVLKGAFLCSKALLPAIIERRNGAIVNIASVNGLTGLGEEAYSAAKAGVINLTRNMAVKDGSSGVRVNCVCPGTIRTPIWQSQLETDPQLFDRLIPWYPLGRVGDLDDVARAVLFLASDEASWITGVALPVDGGMMAGSYRMSRDLLERT